MRAVIKDALMSTDSLTVDTHGVPGFFYLCTNCGGKEGVIALDDQGVIDLAHAVASFLRGHPELSPG